MEDTRRASEAEAILRRVAEETDPQIGAGAGRMLFGARAHLAAKDADQDDALEVLGTRIGRGLGLVAFLAMAAMLLTYFLRS